MRGSTFLSAASRFEDLVAETTSEVMEAISVWKDMFAALISSLRADSRLGDASLILLMLLSIASVLALASVGKLEVIGSVSSFLICFLISLVAEHTSLVAFSEEDSPQAASPKALIKSAMIAAGRPK